MCNMSPVFSRELFFFALRHVAALFCVQKLFFLSSVFHTLHFSALQKMQRSAERRSKCRILRFLWIKEYAPGASHCVFQAFDKGLNTRSHDSFVLTVHCSCPHGSGVGVQEIHSGTFLPFIQSEHGEHTCRLSS